MPRLAELTWSNSIADGLLEHGSQPALVSARGTLTYAELDRRVEELIEQLGDARRLVLLRASNDVGSLVAYLACLRGGHPVLLAPANCERTQELLGEAYRPDVSLSGGGDSWSLDEHHPHGQHELHPDLAMLIPTSGSTGSPKLVRLSRENLEANARSIAHYLKIHADDRAATSLPMHYCYGLSVINSHLIQGASLTLSQDSVVDQSFWELFRDTGATSFAGVPYTFELLDRIGFEEMDLPSLRYVTQAGGRLAPNCVKRYAELGAARGWDFYVMYGQTEATARMAYLPPALAQHRPEAIGIPVPGGSFSIEPLEGVDEVAEGNVGELVYSGPNVMLGYAELPADLSLGKTVDSLRTGDIGRLASDGLYEITGRRSRFLKIFGVRTDLDRAEAVLASHGVQAFCVGTDQHLIVASEQALDRPMIARIANEELGLTPSVLQVSTLDSIPRLATGKPDYRSLLELATAPRTTEDRDERQVAGTAAKDKPPLTDLFRDVLGRTGVTQDSTFVSLGGDSLSYVEMSAELENHLGHLPANWHVTPIRDLQAREDGRRQFGRSIEAGVVIRALAAVAIVGTHVQLFSLRGSAHILVALAGFNFARFLISPDSRLERVKRQALSLARLVIPSAAWILAVMWTTDAYSPMNAVFLNQLIGPEQWTLQWHFWFLEILIYIMVMAIPVMAVPAIDRAERRWPFWFAIGLLAIGLVMRFEIVSLEVTNTRPAIWLFALGWAAAKCENVTHRLILTVVALAAIPGFFDDVAREAMMLGGIAAFIWIRSIRMPAFTKPLLTVLASSSLYIYLVHWQVYPLLLDHPELAVFASLLAGVAYWAVASRAMAAAERLAARLGRYVLTRRQREPKRDDRQDLVAAATH